MTSSINCKLLHYRNIVQPIYYISYIDSFDSLKAFWVASIRILLFFAILFVINHPSLLGAHMYVCWKLINSFTIILTNANLLLKCLNRFSCNQDFCQTHVMWNHDIPATLLLFPSVIEHFPFTACTISHLGHNNIGDARAYCLSDLVFPDISCLGYIFVVIYKLVN